MYGCFAGLNRHKKFLFAKKKQNFTLKVYLLRQFANLSFVAREHHSFCGTFRCVEGAAQFRSSGDLCGALAGPSAGHFART